MSNWNLPVQQYVIVLGLPPIDLGLKQLKEARKNENPTDQTFIDLLHNALYTRIHHFLPDLKKDKIQVKFGDRNEPSYAIVDCEKSDVAQELQARADFLQFDSKFVLRFVLANEFKKVIASIPSPPKEIPNPPPLHFSYFLHEDIFCEQFLAIYGQLPHMESFDPVHSECKSIILPNDIKQVQSCTFTPNGTFFVTSTENGIINLYGGEKWSLISTFEHPLVKDIMFSSDSRYMAAKSEIMARYDQQVFPRGLAVFDIVMGNCVRRIPLVHNTFDNEDNNEFKYVEWGFNSTLFSCQGFDLYCYRPPKFEIGKPLIECIEEYQPSPSFDMVFVFKKETATKPQRFIFLKPSDGSTIHMQPAYNITEVTAKWHPKLPICLLQLQSQERKKIIKKITIFDFRGKNPSFYTETFEHGDIIDICWDPTAPAFAAITTQEGSGITLNSYIIGTNLVKDKSFSCGQTTRVQISPQGRFAVTDDVENDCNLVQFWDLQTGKIGSQEIDGVKQVEYDPFGIFVLVCAPKKMYTIYMFDGTIASLPNRNQLNLSACMWRPYNINDVSKENIEAIQSKVDEAMKKNGSIGIMDPKLKDKQMKEEMILKLKKYETIMEKIESKDSFFKNKSVFFQIESSLNKEQIEMEE